MIAKTNASIAYHLLVLIMAINERMNATIKPIGPNAKIAIINTNAPITKKMTMKIKAKKVNNSLTIPSQIWGINVANIVSNKPDPNSVRLSRRTG